MGETLTMYDRAGKLLSPGIYADAAIGAPDIGECDPIGVPEDQYILRMPVMVPGTPLLVPDSLAWLAPTIARCARYQSTHFGPHPYAYVTVRCGVVRSEGDDEWHVDGFSMKVPHRPEHNYLWSDHDATEVLRQRFAIPADFDPLRHNIHRFFRENADPGRVHRLRPKRLYAIDPYVVHRRPRFLPGTRRSYFRVSFLPIPIRTAGNRPNPLLPMPDFGDEDIRHRLTRYPHGGDR